MALLKSKQLSTNLSGSYTITGSLETTENISGSYTSTGSFGRLQVAGNTSLIGDITIGGNMTFGDADSDSLSISADLTSNLIPDADSTYDIGSSSKNWRFGYIEQLSATHVTASGNISGSSTSTGSFGQLEVYGTQGLTVNQGAGSGYSTFGGAISDPYYIDIKSSRSGTDASLGVLSFYNGANVLARIIGATDDAGGDYDDGMLTFSTRPNGGSLTERLRISEDGKVGIGTTAPGVALEVVGSISGSSTSTGSFGSVHTKGYVGIGTTQPTYALDVGGDIGLNRYLYHNDDSDTRLNFTTDRFRVEVGGLTFIDIFEGTQDTITLGGSDDIDAKLQGGDGYVFVQGSDGYVGIKDDSPSYQLDVAGTGRFTGITKVTDTTNSTSTSTGALIIDGGVGIVKDLVVGGTVTAQEFHSEFVSASILYTSGSAKFGDTGDDVQSFTGSLLISGSQTSIHAQANVLVGGNLSGSYTSTGSFGRVSTTGDIYSSGRIYESGTSVVDHATAMAIVFGG